MASVHGCLPSFAAVRSLELSLGLVVFLVLGIDTSYLNAAAPPELAPVFWKQRVFFIPYQINQRESTGSQIAKVQLLVSQDGVTGWRTLQEAAPNVRGFGYHAPQDGDYWFALRHLDQQGQPWPNAAIQPLMHITVDTLQPKLDVSGTLGESGTIEVHYESRDSNLRPESLVVEARAAGGSWSRVRLGPPEVSQPDHLAGTATWVFPHTAKNIEIRASISDQAAHQVQSTTVVAVDGPVLQLPSAPAMKEPAGLATVDPFQSVSKPPAREWPANNRLPSPQASNSSPPRISKQPPQQFAGTPPLRNPYTMAQNPSGQGRLSAQLIGGSGLSKLNDAAGSLAVSGTLGVSRSLGSNNQNSAGDASGWAAPPLPSSRSGLGDRMVNSLAFDIEYDLQSVGPWGVAKVELWGTHDEGKTWQSYTVDSDNRSPVRVSVPDEGVYGFRILVDGANGVGATPPRSGDKPELIVAVDLQTPRAELLSTELGQGNLADHLQLRWAVEDRNLEPRPIGLFYSTNPHGPWSTIASGLENTGSYTWRMQRHMPNQFYVRLEARDMAGNLATDQTSTPISLSRPQPTGRLRSVRPIGY